MKFSKLIKALIPRKIKNVILQKLEKRLTKTRIKYVDKGANYPFEGDGLATRHNMDFVLDPLFAEAYHRAEPYLLNPRMYWRVYIVCWAAKKGLELEGDFVECGVYKGGFARAITYYTDFQNVNARKYYLFDTYGGLDKKYASEKDINRENNINRYNDDYFDVVQDYFKQYQNVCLVKGTVPDTLQEVNISQVSFLSIDMNNAYPEIEALKHFWPKLSSGALVVLDDYGWRGFEEQKDAHNSLAKKLGTEILTLPTGQGLLLKR